MSNAISAGKKWAFSFDIKGTGVYKQFGVEWSSPFNSPTGNVPTDWTRVSSTGTAADTGANPVILYFDSRNVALDVYIKLPKLEHGNVATDWTPAPEDVQSDISKRAIDTSVVHNTGNETIAGNKTLTGLTTMLTGNYGFRVTSSGFQKTTDGGTTWVAANL